jgi:hypothetical protein
MLNLTAKLNHNSVGATVLGRPRLQPKNGIMAQLGKNMLEAAKLIERFLL